MHSTEHPVECVCVRGVCWKAQQAEVALRYVGTLYISFSLSLCLSFLNISYSQHYVLLYMLSTHLTGYLSSHDLSCFKLTCSFISFWFFTTKFRRFLPVVLPHLMVLLLLNFDMHCWLLDLLLLLLLLLSGVCAIIKAIKVIKPHCKDYAWRHI